MKNRITKNCILSVKEKARKIKRDLATLYLSYKHPDMPFHAKIVALLVVGYALSPIDLIPDFIPVLGYLDDLILLPLGIALAIKLIPSHIMTECRQESENIFNNNEPKNWVAGGIIILIWIIIITYILIKVLHK